ncbi:MAG: S41 family peptidase [bacterium]|nr:S41 family peptidase [bacterium]
MIKISFNKLRKLLFFTFVIAFIFATGFVLGNEGFKARLDSAKNIEVSRELPPGKENIDFSLFWKVWDTLESQYFDKSKINRTNMVYGAIEGMVSALGDPYTVFLPPGENRVVQEDLSGSFEGVGIQIGFKGSQLAVIAPLPDSPAEKAGIKAGDFIIGIKDEGKKIETGTVGITLPEAVKMIRGKAGTKVTLILTRDESKTPLSIEVERKKLDVPSVILSYTGKDNTVANVKILKFGGETRTQWNEKVDEIVKNKNIKGMVLDLRNNPGGYLEGAVDIYGEFVKTGSVGVIEERANGNRKEFKTNRIGKLTSMPLVVLVNGGSASASEILAGALSDVGRAELVGTKTFGKGSIQEPIQINGGSGLHLTIAKWLTPNGTWVNEKGLEPDVKIEDDDKTTEDEQLQEAVNVLENSK